MTEYRIDDLARKAGTTTRNVRGYQDRGLLPRPVRRGRIAVYSDAHLERLRVINNLLRRGFTTRHIADFFTGMQRGDDLAEVLGLEDVVTKPWSSAHATTMPATALTTQLNAPDPRQFARMADDTPLTFLADSRIAPGTEIRLSAAPDRVLVFGGGA